MNCFIEHTCPDYPEKCGYCRHRNSIDNTVIGFLVAVIAISLTAFFGLTR